jgi:transposase
MAKENRQTQADFKCQSCGDENNADLVGALNVLAAEKPLLLPAEARALAPR